MQAYSAAASGPAVNLGVIDGVVTARKQLSQLLGAPSYAHYQVCCSQLLRKLTWRRSLLDHYPASLHSHPGATAPCC